MTTPPPSTGDGGVEELAQPAPRAGVQRLRLDIAVGAAVLFGVLLIVRAQGGGDDPVGSASSTPAAQPSSSSASSVHAGRAPLFPVQSRQEGNRARCPSGFECPVSPVASAGIQRALKAAFPDAQVVSARVVRSVVEGYGQTIWSADVVARSGGQEIRLRLQPLSPEDHERHSTMLIGGHSITRWEGVLSQLRVVVDVVAPADEPASLAAVEQLAHDAQMLSPW
jgi:hypothetical protein